MMEENRTCPICGKETSHSYGKWQRFGLCVEHSEQLRNGEIEQCPDCGKWHKAGEACECKKKQNITQEVSKKCLLCNNNSGEYLFCKSCFAKYKNKTLLLKVTVDNNQKIELLNESYEGIYVCKDGHVVKSKSERDIDNYLFEHKIAHAYEKSLPINGEIFKPDFYLPDLDVYIEHWGFDESNTEYTRRKEYKIPKYKEKGITLICTYEATDMKDVETSLQIKLETYKKGEINFL